MPTCTRRIEFDAAHRVMRHESKCRHLHGHRYVADVTCEAPALDSLGRVVDFGVIKERVGGWVDEYWDHATLLNGEDAELGALCERNGWRYDTLRGNPTAENIARVLFDVAEGLLEDAGVRVVHVRVYETPNCWADFAGPPTGGWRP